MHVMQRKTTRRHRRHQLTIFDHVRFVRSWILDRDGCGSTMLPQAISEFLLRMVGKLDTNYTGFYVFKFRANFLVFVCRGLMGLMNVDGLGAAGQMVLVVMCLWPLKTRLFSIKEHQSMSKHMSKHLETHSFLLIY